MPKKIQFLLTIKGTVNKHKTLIKIKRKKNEIRVLQNQSLFKRNVRCGTNYMLIINFPRH